MSDFVCGAMDLNDALINVILPLDLYKHLPFPSEISFDALRLLLYDHLTPDVASMNTSQPMATNDTNMITVTSTPKITQEFLIRICTLLFRLQDPQPQIPLEKFLPPVLRCLRSWRLRPAEEKSGDEALGKLALDLAGLVNCCASVKVGEHDPRWMKIRWIRAEEEDEEKAGVEDTVLAGPLFDQAAMHVEPGPPSASVISTQELVCANPDPTAKFRSGCLSCHKPRKSMELGLGFPSGSDSGHNRRSISLSSLPSHSHRSSSNFEQRPASHVKPLPPPVPPLPTTTPSISRHSRKSKSVDENKSNRNDVSTSSQPHPRPGTKPALFTPVVPPKKISADSRRPRKSKSVDENVPPSSSSQSTHISTSARTVPTKRDSGIPVPLPLLRERGTHAKSSSSSPLPFGGNAEPTSAPATLTPDSNSKRALPVPVAGPSRSVSSLSSMPTPASASACTSTAVTAPAAKLNLRSIPAGPADRSSRSVSRLSSVSASISASVAIPVVASESAAVAAPTFHPRGIPVVPASRYSRSVSRLSSSSTATSTMLPVPASASAIAPVPARNIPTHPLLPLPSSLPSASTSTSAIKSTCIPKVAQTSSQHHPDFANASRAPAKTKRPAFGCSSVPNTQHVLPPPKLSSAQGYASRNRRTMLGDETNR